VSATCRVDESTPLRSEGRKMHQRPVGQMSETYHHGDLRRQLVTTAIEMLQENDEAEISLRSVARRMGVSSSAPYRHYSDKSQLLAAVAAAGFNELRELLVAADRRAKPDRAIAAQGVAYVRFALANAALFHLMFGRQGASTSPERHIAGDAAYGVLVDRVAARYLNDALAGTRALGFWSAMHGLATLAIDGRVSDKGNPETLMKAVLILFDK